MADGDGPEAAQNTAEIFDLPREQFPGASTPQAQAEGRKERPEIKQQEGPESHSGGGGVPEEDFSVTSYEPTVRASTWPKEKPKPADQYYRAPGGVTAPRYGQRTRTDASRVVRSTPVETRPRSAEGPIVPGVGRVVSGTQGKIK